MIVSDLIQLKFSDPLELLQWSLIIIITRRQLLFWSFVEEIGELELIYILSHLDLKISKDLSIWKWELYSNSVIESCYSIFVQIFMVWFINTGKPRAASELSEFKSFDDTIWVAATQRLDERGLFTDEWYIFIVWIYYT
jgi:hypothetical protein